MKYKMITRDWKGSYSKNKLKGWYVFATEDKIQTGQDSYAMILCDSKITPEEHTPQVIYDVIEAMECGEDIEGFEYIDQYAVVFRDKPTEGN